VKKLFSLLTLSAIFFILPSLSFAHETVFAKSVILIIDGKPTNLQTFLKQNVPLKGTCVRDAAPLTDADTLDGLDSSRFLRSDIGNSCTSGTLNFGPETMLSIDGKLKLRGTDITMSAEDIRSIPDLEARIKRLENVLARLAALVVK